VFDEYNEVLKLAYDGKAIFAVPAFRSFYWFSSGQIDAMMKFAHFTLTGGFGLKTGHSRTKKVEDLLSF
jgi:hypothetical protein